MWRFHLVIIGVLWAASLTAAATEEAPGTVLITGSNRGIGYAFAEHYVQAGWQVIATCRDPERAEALQRLAARHDNLRVEALDITSASGIDDLRGKLSGQPVDVLINNAALLGEPAGQNFGQLDFQLFERSVAVNLIGPLRVSEALLENVAASEQKKMVFIGSAAGSNGLLGPGLSLMAYRSAKAGLHLAVHQLAGQLAPRGVAVGLLNPGIVDTRGIMDRKPGDPVPDVFKPLLPLIDSGQLQMARPPDAVASMAVLIDELSVANAGRFVNVDGQELPW